MGWRRCCALVCVVGCASLLAVSHNFFDRFEGLVVLLVACCDRGAL